MYVGGNSKKAKQRRLERKLAKQASGGQHQANSYQRVKNTKSTEKSLHDFINDVGPQDKHKLKVSSIWNVIIFRWIDNKIEQQTYEDIFGVYWFLFCIQTILLIISNIFILAPLILILFILERFNWKKN